jgi:hypothetical protein
MFTSLNEVNVNESSKSAISQHWPFFVNSDLDARTRHQNDSSRIVHQCINTGELLSSSWIWPVLGFSLII